MSENHEVIRVFVASPGGLDSEREAVAAALDDVNRRNGQYWKVQFKPVGWEETVGGNRRAQYLINRDLQTCDYFVGILGDHWGSPPQASADEGDSKYTSGFQEEFELAQALFEKGEMKDIFLFFRKIPEERLRDVGPSLQSVLDFRKKINDQRKPLYFEFDQIDKFSRKIGDTFTDVGWRHSAKEKPPVETSSKTKLASEQPLKKQSSSESDEFLFDDEVRTFLTSVIQKSRASSDGLEAHEISRLRLIASEQYTSVNDLVRIGPHDSNIIFRSRNDIKLSWSEKFALIQAGLKYLEHQNVPLWHWFNSDTPDGKANHAKQLIQNYMAFPDGDETVSAIKLGAALGCDIPTFEMEDGRSVVLKSWFKKDAPHNIRPVVNDYLICHGKEEDIDTLDEIGSDLTEYNTSDIDSIATAIAFSISTDFGFSTLEKRNPERLNEAASEVVATHIQSLPSDEIAKFAAQKSEAIRLSCVKELRKRRALSSALAEELSADSSFDVRLETLLALSDCGEHVSNERARSLLVKAAPNRVFGITGFFSSNSSDKSRYESYQKHLLRHLTLEELLERDDIRTPFDADAFLAACESYPRQMSEKLREAIADGFVGRFTSRIAELRQLGEFTEKNVQDAERLGEYTRKAMMDSATSILVRKMKIADLHLIRNAVDRGDVSGTSELLAYFGRFGDWNDFDRIVRLERSISTGRTLLGIGLSDDNFERNKARSLYQIGKDRFVDLLGRIDDPKIKSEVIRNASQRSIADISDNLLLDLLNNESDEIRKITSIRAIQTVPKRRISVILEKYINSDDYRYYNVIHWLDLGISMPKKIVMKVTEFESQN